MPFCNESNYCGSREWFNGQQMQQERQISVTDKFLKAVHSPYDCEAGKATATGWNG